MKNLLFIYFISLIFFSCESREEIKIREQKEQEEYRKKKDSIMKESFVYKNFYGKHPVRRLRPQIEVNQNSYGSYFLIIGSYSSKMEYKYKVTFSWKMRDTEEYIISTVDTKDVRIVIDSIYTKPQVSFDIDWYDFSKEGYVNSYSKSPNSLINSWDFNYITIFCNENDYPENIQLDKI